jgi:hypothetical protein
MLRSPKCALKSFNQVKVCLLKVLGLCKSMLGLPIERRPQRPALYMIAGYLEHLSSQFWISSLGIGNLRGLSLTPISNYKCLN